MSNGEEVVEVVTVDGLGELEGTDLISCFAGLETDRERAGG